MGNGDLTFNHDGSVDIPIEGQPVRYVKESDLLTVKNGSEAKGREWETERTGYQSQLAEANRLRDESNQLLLQERAAKEQLVTQYADYDTFKVKVGELEKEVESQKGRADKHEDEIASRIRHTLIVHHGASEEQVKEKTLDQLRNLEEAARVFGGLTTEQKPARYDGGQAPSGAGAESNIERARRIIEEAESKRGRPIQVSNTALK